MRVPTSIRRFTDPVLERVPVPIVGGANRGRWWSLASAGSGYASGRRAGAQLRMLRALFREGDVVWDVGAHHGYVTLLAADRVGPRAQVHAFEPAARNAAMLERHLRWNRVRNTTVHRLALGARAGEVSFGGGGTSKTHALGRGEQRVPVRTGADLVRAGEAAPPDFMKIDVEGGEADVLTGMLEVLPPGARILVALHSAAADEECTRLLRAHDFELIPSRALDRARRTSWRSDPDLLCIGPGPNDRTKLRQLLRNHGF